MEVSVENPLDIIQKKSEIAMPKLENIREEPKISIINNPYNLLEEKDIVLESQKKKELDAWEEPGKNEHGFLIFFFSSFLFSPHLTNFLFVTGIEKTQVKIVTAKDEEVNQKAKSREEKSPSTPLTQVPLQQLVIDEIEVPSDWTSLLPED